MPEFPFPRKGGGMSDMTPMPKMPGGTGDGMRKTVRNDELQSPGPKGGKMPTPGTRGGLPRRHSD